MKSPKLWLVILGCLLLVASGSGAGYYLYKRKQGVKPDEPSKEKDDDTKEEGAPVALVPLSVYTSADKLISVERVLVEDGDPSLLTFNSAIKKNSYKFSCQMPTSDNCAVGASHNGLFFAALRSKESPPIIDVDFWETLDGKAVVGSRIKIKEDLYQAGHYADRLGVSKDGQVAVRLAGAAYYIVIRKTPANEIEYKFLGQSLPSVTDGGDSLMFSDNGKKLYLHNYGVLTDQFDLEKPIQNEDPAIGPHFNCLCFKIRRTWAVHGSAPGKDATISMSPTELVISASDGEKKIPYGNFASHAEASITADFWEHSTDPSQSLVLFFRHKDSKIVVDTCKIVEGKLQICQQSELKVSIHTSAYQVVYVAMSADRKEATFYLEWRSTSSHDTGYINVQIKSDGTISVPQVCNYALVTPNGFYAIKNAPPATRVDFYKF